MKKTRNVQKKRTQTSVSLRAVKQMIEARKEVKSFQIAATYNNTVAGQVDPLTQGVIQGDNIDQRSGDVIFPKSLQLNLSVLGGAATVAFNRVIVFRDMLNTGAIPTVASVLVAAAYNATYNWNTFQQKRYHILHDKIYGVAVGSNSQTTHVQIRVPLKGKIFYNDTTAIPAANGAGAIFFLTMTNSIVSGTSGISYYSKIDYTDA